MKRYIYHYLTKFVPTSVLLEVVVDRLSINKKANYLPLTHTCDALYWVKNIPIYKEYGLMK